MAACSIAWQWQEGTGGSWRRQMEMARRFCFERGQLPAFVNCTVVNCKPQQPAASNRILLFSFNSTIAECYSSSYDRFCLHEQEFTANFQMTRKNF
jgi:hypothetical protein